MRLAPGGAGVRSPSPGRACALCDIATYVRNFETLLLRMWQHYCAGDPNG